MQNAGDLSYVSTVTVTVPRARSYIYKRTIINLSFSILQVSAASHVYPPHISDGTLIL